MVEVAPLIEEECPREEMSGWWTRKPAPNREGWVVDVECASWRQDETWVRGERMHVCRLRRDWRRR